MTILVHPKPEIKTGYDGNLRLYWQVHLSNGVTSDRFYDEQLVRGWIQRHCTEYVPRSLFDQVSGKLQALEKLAKDQGFDTVEEAIREITYLRDRVNG